MRYEKLNKFENLILNLQKKYRLLNLLIVFILLPLIYIIVYQTGGVKFVYSHLMYIPIVFAGFALGIKYGIITGIIAGILLGPLMPLDTMSNEPQLTFNWIFRLTMFVIIGLICGYSSFTLRKNIKIVKDLFTSNQDTKIPNINSLADFSNKSYDPRKHIVMTILVNNYDNIIDLLGMEVYNNILNLVYANLKKELPDGSMIIQSESNKFWISKLYENLYDDINYVLRILNEPISIEGIPLYVEFSIGVNTVKNQESCLYGTAYRNSDLSARFAQKNNLPYIIFDEKLLYKRGDFELVSMFKKALVDNETRLVYQPKIDLSSNNPIGIEALIRWEHPKRGSIFPDTFIPLIEETQLIHLLTFWVLKQAINKIEEFKKHGIDVLISINVSAKNLLDMQFFNNAIKLIDNSSVNPNQIELEITESALMINPEESKAILKKFKDSGFTISLDDFGKGYSSLAYLSDFSFEIIKIDQYFIRRIVKDNAGRNIVEATIDLAHKLGCKVVLKVLKMKNVHLLLKN